MKAPIRLPIIMLLLTLLTSCNKYESNKTITKRKPLVEEKAEAAYLAAQKTYLQEKAILSLNNSKERSTELKKLILVKHNSFNKERRSQKIKFNGYKNFPYLLYKAALDDTIFTLEKRARLLQKRYPHQTFAVAQKIATTLTMLEQLNNELLHCDEYHQEMLVSGNGGSSGIASGLFRLGFAGLSAGVTKGVGSLL